MTSLRLIFVALFASVCLVGVADDTRQRVFDSAFKSLQVYIPGHFGAPPVVNLADPADRVVIEFDELASDRRYLRYSLTHCDAAWRPEGLVDSEFLDSFNEGRVEDYAFSQATQVHYVNYRITLPNSEVRITQPGNYLVRVYDEQDPDRTLLQARFGVIDPQANIRLEVTSRTDIDTNQAHQQLEIEVDTRHLGLEDPFGDLRVVVTQNGRPDNERLLVTPVRLGARSAIYEHIPALIFPAGNEYRRFETVSLTYPGMGVEAIDLDAPVVNMALYTDTPRARQNYLYDQTQQGRYLVRDAANSLDDASTRADYVLVLFSLDTGGAPLPQQGDIFIEGDLTNRTFDPASRMVFNHLTGRYEQQLLLKQGSYNYQYLFVPPGSLAGTAAPVEGDKYQTVNEYTVRVYHRPRGSRFDRLVGISTITASI